MTKKTEAVETVRGSGNVFADFGHANAVAEQVKAFLAAEIIEAMDAQEISARQAESRTGIAASDLSRIRHVKLDRLHDRPPHDDPRTSRRQNRRAGDHAPARCGHRHRRNLVGFRLAPSQPPTQAGEASFKDVSNFRSFESTTSTFNSPSALPLVMK